MKRIDTSTKAVDLFGAGKHGFKDGNKALGIAATVQDAGIWNSIQEEICRVIEAAGIALDGATYNQLLSALTAGWGMSKLLTTSGYLTLPGGVILQWTSVAITTANTFQFVTLPIAFPNAILGLMAGAGGLNQYAAVALSGSDLYRVQSSNNQSGGGNWIIAIGK